MILSKRVVNWSSVFCMFCMTLTRPSLTMQLTSVMDVFAHVCGQKADTSSNCDSVQLWQETLLFLSNMTRFFRLFFFKLPQFHTSNFRKVVRQHTEDIVGILHAFCWKFTWLSSSERILKIRYKLTKLSPWDWCTTFGTLCRCPWASCLALYAHCKLEATLLSGLCITVHETWRYWFISNYVQVPLYSAASAAATRM